ncbi:MAG TPA: sialidase family protein [Gemmatimonadaceae bacterium]|nr:sialidase family protein [Gemmatimonadaceae bacterium]
MAFRLCAIALMVLAACSSSDRQGRAAARVTALSSPAGPQSGEPFLASDAAGAVHMTWIEKTGDSTYAVRYARLDGATWTRPTTVVERRDLFVNWADYPSVIATPSGRLLVHWLQRSSAGRYAYDVRIAQSTDRGATWSEGALLHTDRSAAEHGFVALWTAPGDSVRAAWLDGRHTTPDTGGHARGAMSVQAVSVASSGALGTEQPVDLRTCDCCQVAATVAASGPVVAYRDRTEDEIRDIAVVRLVDGKWTTPSIVHPDGWHIDACPVNGPALAARGDTVAIAWFTGAQDTARVRVAFSVDGGEHFAPPVRVDGGTPAGRVGIALDQKGDALVSWLERVPPEDAEVRLRRVARSGELGVPLTISRTKAARAAGFPRIVRRGDSLLAAWTVPGDSARVMIGSVPVGELR